MSSHCATSIEGICNLLRGGKRVGVHAVRHLEENEFPFDVHLLDGGTGGFHLLSLFQEITYVKQQRPFAVFSILRNKPRNSLCF